MPVNASNENTDILGDVLKRGSAIQNEAYDPYQWQAAENGRANNRVLVHGSGDDSAQVAEAPTFISRQIELPETDREAIPTINRFFEDNGDLKPHEQAIVAEVTNIRRDAPTFSSSDTFNLAVARVCKANGLSLERQASLPAPANVPTLNDELKRLEGEARKVRTYVGEQDYASIRQAVIATSPKRKK